MEGMVEIFGKTPLWIWSVFAVSIWVGFSQLYTGRRSCLSVLVLPAVLMGASLASLHFAVGLDLTALGAWTLAVGTAVFINEGKLRYPRRGVSWGGPKNDTYRVPGSPVPLFLILIVLVLKFLVDANGASTLELPARLLLGGLLGLLSGALFARGLRILQTPRSRFIF
jgi:hypothetical protein